jgi:hypothetical protein
MGRLLYSPKFVSIRKEAIHTVPFAVYSICCRYFVTKKILELYVKKSAKMDKARNPRNIVTSLAGTEGLASTSVQARSGPKCKIVFLSFWANNLRFLAKLLPIVKSERKCNIINRARGG